jgi:hypothetical protein
MNLQRRDEWMVETHFLKMLIYFSDFFSTLNFDASILVKDKSIKNVYLTSEKQT